MSEAMVEITTLVIPGSRHSNLELITMKLFRHSALDAESPQIERC